MESSIKYVCQVCERNLIVKWKCKDCLDTFRDNCRKINGNLSFTQSHTVTRLEDAHAQRMYGPFLERRTHFIVRLMAMFLS